MPRTKEQFEALRIQKIELIEDAAMECFAAVGFHGTSISSIAKKAGISTGLTYNYFSSKEDLLTSIYLKGMKNIFEPVEQLKVINEKGFRAFIDHIFTEMKNNTTFWKLYFIVMSQPDILAKYQEHIMKTIAPLTAKMSSYFKKKGISEPEAETRLLFSLLDGICMNYLTDNEHYPLDKIRKKILSYYGQ
jgi:AcrR family transcriptional regulator